MHLRRVLLVALASATCSCQRDPAGMEKRPKLRVAGGPAYAPAGGKWTSARVEVDLIRHVRTASGRNLPYEQVTWSVEPSLVLAGAGGEVRVRLADGVHGNPDAAALLAAADAGWKVVWAPDGRGVACISDVSPGWLWVACDGPRPLHFWNIRIAPAEASNACAHAPGWRGLALEAMAPVGQNDGRLYGFEWERSASFIVEAPDPELMRAFAEAAVREMSGLSLPDLEPELLRPLQRAAAADEEVVRTAIAALGRKQVAGTQVSSNAATLLGAATSDEALRALAAALVSRDWAPAGKGMRDSEWPEAIGWALARAIEARRSIPADVEASLLEALPAPAGSSPEFVPLLFALGMHGSPEARGRISSLGGWIGPRPKALATLDEVATEIRRDLRLRQDPLDLWGTRVVVPFD